MNLKSFRRNLYVVLFSTACVLLSCRCSSPSASNKEYLEMFDWVVKTYKENDAGYAYYLKQKGAADIEKQTTLSRQKIARAASEAEAVGEINAWLHGFRTGHTGLFPKTRVPDANAKKLDITETDFRRYLEDNRTSLHPVEGVWETRDFVVGIMRNTGNAGQFRVFMLNDKNGYGYEPSTHIADCFESDNGSWESVFYMKNNQAASPFYWLGESKGVLYMQRLYWIKQSPEVRFSPEDEVYRMQITDKPFLLALNDKTLYLRIHSFMSQEKAGLDRLLAENDRKIRAASNLIIDIRNGTGGSDYSHFGLLPYYYTQPIRNINHSHYATGLSVKTYEKYAEECKDDPQLADTFRKKAAELRENIGKYVQVPLAGIISGYRTSAYPERIAVIFNRRNASADESFLYMARQSYKVKLFGEPTAGAFNVSNIAFVDSPDGKYTLWIAQSVSKVFPEYTIDDIGIQPDFYIDKEVADWIGYTRSVIEAR